MAIRLIQIGSSKGIGTPKTIIEKSSFTNEIEAEIKKDGLFPKKTTKPRVGWKEQILKEIKEKSAPGMLIPDNIQNDFDNDEWY